MNKTAFNSRNSFVIVLLALTFLGNTYASKATDFFTKKGIEELEMEETV